ncbi:MAG: VanZ family protein [Bacteroidales bacterium]|jgi:VanZ family protein|nr:VanZ family protein [Bacteroidales bacterium]
MKKGTRIFFGILLLIYLAAVLYLCFSTLQNLPHVQRKIWGIPTDKLVHFVMFLPFPFLMYLTFAPITKKFFKALTHVIIIFGLGCALAAGTEIVQKQLSYRTGDLKDFEADALALIVGSVFILLINFIIAINKSSKQK